MEAFAVFEGGGVKGAALVGALSAAEKHNIKFVGYGGASAGAIVAYLSVIGYNSKELLKILLENRFITFFDDSSGEKLDHLKCWGKSLSNSSFKQNSLKLSPAAYYVCSDRLRKSIQIFNDVCEKKGVYSTNNIKSLLIELTKQKLPNIIKSEESCFNFDELYAQTGIELKIITSDVHNKNAVVFCHDDDQTRNTCVISAVCASAAYPFVFQPNDALKDTSTLIDGGLSSNLPTFLFGNKSHKKWPIYAFDLYKEDELIKEKSNKIDDFAMSIVNTALDASDHIMYGLVDATRINVRVPNYVETLDFKIGKVDVLQMYETGKDSADASFKNDVVTKKALVAGSNSTKLARALYGTSLYMPILESIVNLSVLEPTEKVRAWLYTSVTNNDSEIVSFCWHGTPNAVFGQKEYAFNSMSDSDTYSCWNAKRIMIYEYNNNGEDITRLCLPIFEKHSILNDINKQGSSENRIVGVLVMETNVAKEFSFWVNESGDDVSLLYGEVIKVWLAILSKVMVSKEV